MARSIVGIHIGNRVANALVLRPGKKDWSLLTGLSLPVSGDEDQALPNTLKALARALKLPGGQPATLVLARQQAMIRTVQLPSTDRAELEQMARFEAERHIPFNAERHSVGYHVMRQKGVEGSEVLLGAMDGPVIQNALDAMTAAGLTPDGLTISAPCLVNGLIVSRPELFNDKTVAVLAVGMDALDLVFCHQGRVLYARSAALDLRGTLEAWMGHAPDPDHAAPDLNRLAVAAHMIDCLSADEGDEISLGGAANPEREGAVLLGRWLDRVFQEIRRTHDFARREMKCPPVELLVLTGEGSTLRNLDKQITRITGLPVEHINPVASLPAADRLKFPFGGHEFAIALGAIIGRERPGAYQLDLTPASHYRAMSRRTLIRRLSLTGALLLLCAILGTAAGMRYAKLRNQTLDAYQALNAQMRPKVGELVQMQTKLGIIKGFVNDPNEALTVFNTVVGAPQIPTSVYLDKVAFTKGQVLQLEGQAKTIEEISALITYLNGTGHFVDIVRTQSPTKLEDKPVFSFRLECPLKSEQSEAPDQPKESQS